MSTVKIQPVPGKILVEPVSRTKYYLDMAITGGKQPRKGLVVRTPSQSQKLREKDMIAPIDSVVVKNGDYVYYDAEYCHTIVVDGTEYHLISTWDIIAKEG